MQVLINDFNLNGHILELKVRILNYLMNVNVVVGCRNFNDVVTH